MAHYKRPLDETEKRRILHMVRYLAEHGPTAPMFGQGFGWDDGDGGMAVDRGYATHKTAEKRFDVRYHLTDKGRELAANGWQVEVAKPVKYVGIPVDAYSVGFRVGKRTGKLATGAYRSNEASILAAEASKLLERPVHGMMLPWPQVKKGEWERGFIAGYQEAHPGIKTSARLR